MTLRKQTDFATDNEVRLGQQLSTLEDNIERESADIRASFEPVLALVTFVATAAATTTTARFGTLLAVDSNGVPAFVRLPPPSPILYGRRLVVVRRGGVIGSVTLVAPSGTTVNGVTSQGLTIGARHVYCTPFGYFA